MSFDTGARLRAEREVRKLSQRQLAAAAGVTAAMISMIEQNRASPSIATLKKILAGLNIPLSAFFADDGTPDPKWHFTRDELYEITPKVAGQAKVRFFQVGRPGESALMILYETYLPGADTGPDLYAHDAEEGGIVVSGQIRVTVGAETRLLKAGDAYLFNSRQPHRFQNPGPEDCVVISACTPPTF
jgi:transcriptional regulator with XRE-family HTH domain